jgi:16S rRNA (guanine527-N7)-methyltransferase
VITPALFGPDEFQARTGADARAMADMVVYLELLTDWSARMNLVGPSALQSFWPRHAYDSAQLLALEPRAGQWLDVGSGAGLPGLVLAILGRGRPGMTVQLVESLTKRVTFLREVVRRLDLPASVVHGRVEDARPEPVEVVTARAVAPLPRLLEYTAPLLRKGATGLFHKGRNVEAEVEEALQTWRFDYALSPSQSDPEGRILRVWSVRRASA